MDSAAFLADMRDNDNLKEEHIDLQVNQGCQVKFRTLPLSDILCDHKKSQIGEDSTGENYSISNHLSM